MNIRQEHTNFEQIESQGVLHHRIGLILIKTSELSCILMIDNEWREG